MTLPVKTRFAPSPTGFIHLGNARTALFNFLLARHQQGIFLLRIEDTDKERSTREFDQSLQEDLTWLGLHWDEGPGQEQDCGPYRQSERQTIYDKYYQQLIDAGKAYPCFCSESELSLSRKIQLSQGIAPRYLGTCRSLDAATIQSRHHAGKKPTLRFLVPVQQTVSFEDLVKGPQSFQTNHIGDFIIRRADGTSPFLFCSVIDDALMGITHILRGEDHLTNTPRQILVLTALSLPIPSYGHIALIVGPDGSPLSKRHGSRSIQQLRHEGYLATGIINYMARLGHYYEGDGYFLIEALIKNFTIAGLSKSPAQYDLVQLKYWQRLAIDQLTPAAFWEWVGQSNTKSVPKQLQHLFIETIKPNVLFPRDVEGWIAVCFGDIPPVAEVSQEFRNIAKKTFLENDFQFENVIAALKQLFSFSNKEIYHTLRLALTGRTDGPALKTLLTLMGPLQIEKRLQGL